MPTDDKTLTRLRARIAGIEADHTAGLGRRVFSTGVAALDRALPWGGLPHGAVHELLSADACDGAATGFAAALLVRLLEGGPPNGSLCAPPGAPPNAPVLWAGGRDDLYGPGLARLGLDPGRLLIARCRTGQDTLWALEEGLHCPALAAVVGEVGDLGFGPSRRLQLAAAASGIPLFLLRPYRRGWDESGLPPSAAVTRWRIEAAQSSPAGTGPLQTMITMIGRPRWRLALLRCRGGKPRLWTVERDDETNTLRVVAAAGDRPHRQSAA